jgi:hypothetical protein
MLLHERSGPLQSHEPLELEWSPLSEGGKLGREMADRISPSIRLTRNYKGSLTCCKSATRDPRLYFPSEGRHAEDFYARKNPTASVGSELTRPAR